MRLIFDIRDIRKEKKKIMFVTGRRHDEVIRDTVADSVALVASNGERVTYDSSLAEQSDEAIRNTLPCTLDCHVASLPAMTDEWRRITMTTTTVPQGRHFINRMRQLTVCASLLTKSPAGTTLKNRSQDDHQVSSLRDLAGESSRTVRKLKHPVNKVSSLRDFNPRLPMENHILSDLLHVIYFWFNFYYLIFAMTGGRAMRRKDDKAAAPRRDGKHFSLREAQPCAHRHACKSGSNLTYPPIPC